MNFELLAATEGRPLNFGSMIHASAHAKMIGACGDSTEFWLKIDGDRIRKASFVSYGCEDSMICCGIAARMVEGMRVEDAAALSQEKILAKTPPIRNDHQHCALLAANTIQKAIAVYDEKPAKVPLGQRIKSIFCKEQNDA